jgi:uncharacterized protein (TIGR03437 family)
MLRLYRCHGFGDCLYQFNVVVPDVPASDLVPLTFTLGGNPGTQTLYIAVQTGG